MGTVVETPAEIDAFMAAMGPTTKLLFDSGHCYIGGDGADPLPVLERPIGRVRHFHAKNIRPAVMRKTREAGMSFMDRVRAGVFTVPGDPEGGVDFKPLLMSLAAHDYDGWIVIEAEQDPDIRSPFEYQSLGLRILKAIAKDVGLGA